MLQVSRLPVLLLLVGFYSPADAAILCANPSGSVNVRADVCRPSETKLDPVALGLTGPPGTSGYEVVTVGPIIILSRRGRNSFCPVLSRQKPGRRRVYQRWSPT